MNSKLFFAVSMIVVFLMYAVPYLLLDGLVGPYTYLFWALTASAYLAFAIVFIYKRG